MIYDLRMYDLKPGTLHEYMALVREVGLPVRERHGVKLASWFYTEVGVQNRVWHTWAYQDFTHYAEAKAKFRQDEEWRDKYVPRVLPLIVRQESQIVLSADFAPELPGVK